MRLDRRHALAAALAAPALVSAAPLRAAAPQAGRQAPGFYRLKVGDYEVTIVNDGINRRPNPGEGFVRNADKAAVEAALARDFLPTGHLDITFNITFVNTGRELILFDTGTGAISRRPRARCGTTCRLPASHPRRWTRSCSATSTATTSPGWSAARGSRASRTPS